MSLACQINLIDVNFNLQKSLEICDKKLTKSDPKKRQGDKSISPFMSISDNQIKKELTLILATRRPPLSTKTLSYPLCIMVVANLADKDSSESAITIIFPCTFLNLKI